MYKEMIDGGTVIKVCISKSEAVKQEKEGGERIYKKKT